MFAASVANIKENTLLPTAASPPYSSAIVEQCHIKIMLLIWSPRKIVSNRRLYDMLRADSRLLLVLSYNLQRQQAVDM